MKTHIISYLSALFALAIALVSPITAATSSTLTNTITLDTRGSGGLAVTGRMLNAQTNAALPGASVTLAGLNTTSASNGSFTLANVSLASGTTLTTSATGFLPQTKTVTAAAGVKAVNVGDIALTPNTNKPVVESVSLSNPKGTYLRGLPDQFRQNYSRPTAKAKVNWNGNTPGTVEFWANNRLVGSPNGAGPEYSVIIPVDDYFNMSGGDVLTVVAKAAGNTQISKPLPMEVRVVTLHAFVRWLLATAPVSGSGNLEVDFLVPPTPKSQSVTLPLVGEYGCKLQLGGSFDFSFDDGSWEVALGVSDTATQGKRGRRPVIPMVTRYPKPKIYLGNKEIESSIYGVASGSSLLDPFIIDEVRADLGMSFKGELTRFTLADSVLPGVGELIKHLPKKYRKMTDSISIIMWLTVGADGSIAFSPGWPPDFKEATVNGKIGTEFSWEPSLSGKTNLKVYAGGEGHMKVGVPEPIFREAGLKIYGGAEANLWVFKANREWVILEYTWPSSRRLPLNALHDIGTGNVMEAAANKDATWHPMNRSWRDQGGEVFLLAPADPARRLSTEPSPELDIYSRMEKAPSPGAVYEPAAGPGRRIASDPELPTQAELPLLQNVFPNSEPALATRTNNQMLLYVRDTGSSNPIHFTEIAWTRFDGTTWSVPTAIATDARGQFAPKVAFDGNDNAVAVWERFKDAAFYTADPAIAAAESEIVTSKFDSASSTWSTPVALTNNTWLDHGPQLAGPLVDGDLILTWTENPFNSLIGETGAPSRIMTRRWDAATSTWGETLTLVDNLTGELSVSLAAAGNKAAFLYVRDMDEDITTTADTEIFYRVWDETAGAWGGVTRMTNDAVTDHNARVALDGSGQIFTVWQRGTDLVLDRNLANTPSSVRPDSSTGGFADFSLTLGPGGNLVVLWQEMTDFGSDAHYRVFDPASNTWGLDTLLSQDSELERSFAPAWDSMGNLVLAYNNVTVTKQSKTVTLEGGETVTVEGVPQPGQVDLNLAKRALVKDLTLSSNGLTAEGTTYLPGDVITLKAKVKNSGNVAVENVPVAFYNGDPAAGGTLIQTVPLPGWLKAADEAEATINWTIPEPAIARTVFVKVDPAEIVTEASETNNTLSLPLNGVDLALEYVSGNVLPDGSVRVVAKVKSLSAPESPVTMLRLWRKGGTTALAEVDVSQLTPGDSVEIPLDLPAASQPEGEQAYRLTLDEEALTGDVDPSNNEVLFSLNLWIDGDGDGIPHDWESANGMSDSDPDDANLDIDGDGFTAKQEYLAGTNPRDPSSVLKIGEVARQSTPDGLSTQVSWTSVAGRRYQVERSFDLSSWTILEGEVEATPPLNTVVDSGIPPSGKAFYRLTVK